MSLSGILLHIIELGKLPEIGNKMFLSVLLYHTLRQAASLVHYDGH